MSEKKSNVVYVKPSQLIQDTVDRLARNAGIQLQDKQRVAFTETSLPLFVKAIIVYLDEEYEKSINRDKEA